MNQSKTNTRPSKRKRVDHESALKSTQDLMLPAEVGLLEAEGTEKTYRFSQKEIVANVDEQSARKRFDLRLPQFGPYGVRYGRSGRYMLICGKKGHVAMTDWQRSKMVTELQLKETCRDAIFLHNDTMFAVAQKKYLYIYDDTGLELHCLRNQVEVNKLEFLRYHFLLATVGKAGWLKYTDTSTGDLVSEHRSKLGACDVMTQNPHNAVIVLGHGNGTATMWTPNMSTPVVKSRLTAATVDPYGRYLVTSGLESQIKVWDIRTYKELHAYYSFTPASALDISAKGLLGVGHSNRIEVWKSALESKASAPYLTHSLDGGCVTETLKFCPYEDVAVIGHAKGVSTILVPGAGEPNFDSYTANPYETTKQRRETEVHSLLEKLQPDTIALDPSVIGKIARTREETVSEQRESLTVKAKEKRRARGRSKAIKRIKGKDSFIVDRQRDKRREKQLKMLEEEIQREKAAKNPESVVPKATEPTSILDRFRSKE